MTTRERNLQRIKQLRLMDDDFMKIVFEDNIPIVEYVLQVILQNKDLKVISMSVQKERKNIKEHSVIFDVYAEDSTGKPYDIEIQRADKGAVSQRARYNSSMLDAGLLPKNDEYENLKDSYVIFITENDVLKAGLPIYTIERYIKELNQPFNDGSHILYVNGAYKADNDIGNLMNDFRAENSSEIKSTLLAERVRYFKETQGGNDSMCKIWEDVRNEGIEQGIEKGAKTKALETAQLLLKKGKLTVDEIAEVTGLTVEQVKELAVD